MGKEEGHILNIKYSKAIFKTLGLSAGVSVFRVIQQVVGPMMETMAFIGPARRLYPHTLQKTSGFV